MGQAGTVQRNCQHEIPNLGDAVSRQPNVPGFQVPVDNAPRVGRLQTPSGLSGDLNRLLQGNQTVGGVFNQAFHIATAHEFGDHVGLALA